MVLFLCSSKIRDRAGSPGAKTGRWPATTHIAVAGLTSNVSDATSPLLPYRTAFQHVDDILDELTFGRARYRCGHPWPQH